MKKAQLTRSLYLILLSISLNLSSQIAGSFSVPGTFPSIAAAINTLNLIGIAGPVTINVAAGYTETAVQGGYKLFNVPGASLVNQIFIRKNGIGPNPLLIAYTGVATPTSAVQDGVFCLIGADYITIDGIDIYDPNLTSPGTMEFGYGLYNLNASNGCQHNTIKNCVVSLNRNNGVAGAGLIIGGSRGIEAVSAVYSLNVTPLTITSAAGTNSYNKFYSNLIQNCHNGISLMGFQSGSPFTLSDQQNDIGGSSAVTGNTIINFGGGTGTVSAGIRTKSQYSLNVSFNLIKNNDGVGSDPVEDLYAIYLGPSSVSTLNVNSNTISLSVNTPSLDIYGVYSPASSNSLNINVANNVFTNSIFGGSGSCFMIYEYSNATISNISNNRFNDISGAGYPRSTRIIQGSGGL